MSKTDKKQPVGKKNCSTPNTMTTSNVDEPNGEVSLSSDTQPTSQCVGQSLHAKQPRPKVLQLCLLPEKPIQKEQ
jgi:hypothetical protein